LSLAYIDSTLVIQNINDKKRTSNSVDNRLKSYLCLYEKHYKKFKDLPKEDSKMNYFLGYVLEIKGRNKEAKARYKEAWQAYPLNIKPVLKLLYLSVCK
jgi:deoxycytidine triphosphate deaminase